MQNNTEKDLFRFKKREHLVESPTRGNYFRRLSAAVFDFVYIRNIVKKNSDEKEKITLVRIKKRV